MPAKRVKVRLADQIARVVSIEEGATLGAQFGTDIFLPDGSLGTPASITAYLGLTGTGGVTAHRLLQGLGLGNDHPQYTRKDTLTTRGDLYVRDATTVTRLAKGSTSQFLQSGAVDPAWQTISPVITLSTDLSGNTTLTNLTNGTLAATIVNNAVTDAKLRDSVALSVIGRSANTLGDPADIASSGSLDVLRRSGAAIGFGTIDSTYVSDFAEAAQDAVGAMFVDSSEINFTYDDSGATVTADLIAASVVFAKLQNIATSRILGRVSASTGSIESLTGTQATTLLDTFTSALKGLVPLSGGGTVNYLRADGTWTTPPAGSPGGSTTQVQYNNAGAFAGSAGHVWTDGTSTLGIGTTAAPGVIIGIGGTTTGNSMTLKGGAAVGATSGGGQGAVRGGDGGATSGNGGSASLIGGSATDGNGGNVVFTGGTGTGTNRSGGSVQGTGGIGTGSGGGGAFTLAGGQGGATGVGGAFSLSGGSGGVTSGAGGAATLQGGTAVEGNGGAVDITGRDGVGTNRNGGSVTITAGAATGSGTAGVITLAAGRVRAIDGTAALPTYSFTSDPDTGFFRTTANQIGIALGGSQAMQINGVTTTGAQTATFVATNKPGAAGAGPIAWLPVLTAGGTQGYIPIFGA